MVNAVKHRPIICGEVRATYATGDAMRVVCSSTVQVCLRGSGPPTVELLRLALITTCAPPVVQAVESSFTEGYEQHRTHDQKPPLHAAREPGNSEQRSTVLGHPHALLPEKPSQVGVICYPIGPLSILTEACKCLTTPAQSAHNTSATRVSCRSLKCTIYSISYDV